MKVLLCYIGSLPEMSSKPIENSRMLLNMCLLFKFYYGWHVIQGDKKGKDILACLRILFGFKNVKSATSAGF